MISSYYRLVKPGIVYGNAMTALAAFVFAEGRTVDPLLLCGMLIGLSCIIAASCVINNVIDRDIDIHMERTRERAIPTGRISITHALLFASVLLMIGVVSLLVLTNMLALVVSLFGVVVYLALYTPLKRISRHSTIVGALAGAVPPVVGYTAVTNSLDATALTLFLVLVCWQMVHFLAIGIFRKEEYRAAQLPIMSVRFSVARTKIVMGIYAFLFVYALWALYAVGHLSSIFALSMGAISFGWCVLALTGFRTSDDIAWARTMFFYSLLVLIVFSGALALA